MSLEALVVIAGAILVLDTRTVRVLAAYVVLAAVAAHEAAPAALAAPLPLALFVASFAMKLVVAPLGIWLFASRNVAARDLRPAVSIPVRVTLVVAFALIAHNVSPLPATATYIMLCGLAVLIVHRNLVAAVIGLLVLGTGITVAGTVVAPGLPESVELGAAFDALIATFIGLALVRAFVTHNPLLDVASLRRLRG